MVQRCGIVKRCGHRRARMVESGAFVQRLSLPFEVAHDEACATSVPLLEASRTGMRLLIVPSWLPHRCYPLEGQYVVDQAIAIGELRPSWRVAISSWNQGQNHLSVGHLLKSPSCILRALTMTARTDEPVRENVHRFTHPAKYWREGLGNRDAVLRANRDNLEKAVERFGGIDLIHAHVSYPAGWVAMRLHEETRIPYVVTEHMGPFPLPVYQRPDGALPAFIREPLERAGARIAVSPSLAKRIAEFGIPEPVFVPISVDERMYHPASRPRDDGFVFFTLCGMEMGKGVIDLLDAIALLLPTLTEEERARLRFRLGGEGPAWGLFRDHGRKLGLDRWLTWLGLLPRERARDEYQSSDAFVLASHHESFGIVFVESMACGKPVIATRCGGPEAIVTEDTGVLVDVGRPAELAAAMRSMVRGERTFDVARVRESFLERFSRTAVVNRLDSIYSDVLHRATNSARAS
jgi:glycosyltransferase involved in cell wall biosynthesis